MDTDPHVNGPEDLFLEGPIDSDESVDVPPSGFSIAAQICSASWT